MEVTINGEKQQVADAITTAELVEQLGLTGQRLAVEINREIVPRSQFDAHRLRAGDQIEIVRAIGGGSHSSQENTRCRV